MALPRVDIDYNGEFLNLRPEAGGVICMNRHGDRIHLAIVGVDVARLTVREADDVACALASAAELARVERPGDAERRSEAELLRCSVPRLWEGTRMTFKITPPVGGTPETTNG